MRPSNTLILDNVSPIIQLALYTIPQHTTHNTQHTFDNLKSTCHNNLYKPSPIR